MTADATPEQLAAVETARYLAECGVPIFLADQAKAKGVWYPSAGTSGCGYWLPSKWEQTEADPAVLDKWKPGMAVCALMGHLVDGADVDPRNGGQETFSGLQGASKWPRSYGHQETPSGGFHDLIAALGVGSKDGVRAGLDVKGGYTDGDGRGFLFIAPTAKISKTTGEVGFYRWTVEPDLTDLLDGIADDSGREIGKEIEDSRPGAHAPATDGGRVGAGATHGSPGSDPFTGPAAGRGNPHVGVIPVGLRDTSLRDYAALRRGKGDTYEEAVALMRLRHLDCEQPAGDRYELSDALAKVDSAFANLGPNPEPGTEKYAADLATEVHRLRLRDDAKRAYAAEVAAEHTEDFDALFLDRAALASVVVPPMLIDGVLPAGANAILRGRDGTFKTFLALDWALHVATGRPWQGHEVRQGKVLYIAGEGAFGLSKRIDAWETEHGVTVPPDAFVVRKAALNLHQPGAAFDHLLRFIGDGGFRLVGVDTLRRVTGGADGNSSEMGAVVDNIDRIKVATGTGSTLTLAHTGKDDKDTRGFSGVEDDIDVVWHLDRLRDSSQVVLKHAKMKDGEELRPLTLDAVKVADSLVLRPASRAETGPSHEWAILDWIGNGTDATEVTASMAINGTGLDKSAVYRWLPKLVEKGLLVRVGTDSRPKYRRP